MVGFKKHIVKIIALMNAACFLFSACGETVSKGNDALQNGSQQNTAYASKLDSPVKTNQEDFYNANVIYKLPESVKDNEDISVIVTLNKDSVMDAYKKAETTKTLTEFANAQETQKIVKEAKKEQNQYIQKLNKSGISYKLGASYGVVLNGFEITIKAKNFEKVGKALGEGASLIVGEEYEEAETEIITNDVDVYDTGIFNSSASRYKGDGVVVAVLDTGLDYTHSAFSVKNFTGKKETFTLDVVSEKVDMEGFNASAFTSGLTGEDVYMNKKVPYAYDYADKDPDVLPINSEHGTHVAGIIAGKDDTITGVAPDAQLAIMKVFSDATDGAKSSWILSALEDCVLLGVDVINMSLGSSCGFAREEDNERLTDVYDAIREAGISLITAASNDYNATRASEKNGTLGLTSNPDSGTVGAPSTYAAALSVASVDGVKTPYLKFGEEIIYFNEATASDAKERDFVGEILATVGEGVEEHDFEFVTIPGLGRSSDYPAEKEFYKGKIVLVKRGTTTFEDKVRVALTEKGASGIIIYNNVSGTISMSIGDNAGAVCSISQDAGEMLAEVGTGILHISKENTAGPFMSEFSSWGPTSDLQIKPEITAHGGEILSAIPGQSYERLSGTSMAAPNQAGATAIIRQYVKDKFVTKTPKEVTDTVNQLMMSTADIIHNKNGVPAAVRKQGAGLVNITESTTTQAYLTTYDKKGNVMEKAKLELGDDKDRTGVFEMTFAINNISDVTVSYDVNAIIQTEGISKTYTNHGETTVTQEGYLLKGAKLTVTQVSTAVQNGNTVSVAAGQVGIVKVKVELSAEDKQYLESSFKYGMYVEGFITLKATNGTKVDLNVPMLAFYGDWTEAPIFDEEYYDTHKDELNTGLDIEDKVMPDAYATRAVGTLYSDYIAMLGEYYFIQNPANTQIAASKEHIALSNQGDDSSVAINGIRSIWAGLLRNVKEAHLQIVEDSTGRVVFEMTEYNLRKSYSQGNTLYQSNMDVDFSVLEHELKNNTKYTVTMTTYIDYGTKEEQKNVRNVFEFPIFIDFEAPVVTNVDYYTEYDKDTKKTKLFADLEIYDNHYAMGVNLGQIVPTEPGSKYKFEMKSFGKYVTPVYSSFNSTSKVTIELTDYVEKIKQSAGLDIETGDVDNIQYNNNSFIAICYDYAMNSGTYEIRLPDEIISMYFTEQNITLSPNETRQLSSLLDIYPSDSWMEVLNFKTSDASVADVVNQTLIARGSGTATITATGYNKKGEPKTAELSVTVLSSDHPDYVEYDVPVVNTFEVTGYKTNKAYYSVSSKEREIGVTDGDYDFGASKTLSMFPSESVTLRYKLDSNFPDNTKVVFEAGNDNVTVSKDGGTIVAQKEGTAIVLVSVLYKRQNEWQTTLYSDLVSITIKDPYTTNGMYLMSYKGLGGEVVIPDNRGITVIYPYAFSNYEYVGKDLSAGDVINEEDPYYIKQSAIGDNTIKKIVIPEGVTAIEAYAFAKLTALEEVQLPSTLTRIGLGAFYNCKNLKKINLENAKFINERAFYNCALQEIDLDSVVSIGDYTFQNCKLNYVELPTSSQSLGVGAFYGNKYLASVSFAAPKIKVGAYAFAQCKQLSSIDINAAVISAHAFLNCEELSDVTLGKDVSVLGEYAFTGTKVAAFKLADEKNSILKTEEDGAFLLKNNELIMVAPAYMPPVNKNGEAKTITTNATAIANGAFSGNNNIYRIYAENAKTIGNYAFAGCANLKYLVMDNLESIGDYAFAGTSLVETPNLSNVKTIGKYAFAGTDIVEVTIAPNTKVGQHAFGEFTLGEGSDKHTKFCEYLATVTIGEGAVIDDYAFNIPIYSAMYEQTESLKYYQKYVYTVTGENGEEATYEYYRYNIEYGVISSLRTVTIYDNVTLGAYAFFGNSKLEKLTLGKGTVIGDYAFFNSFHLAEVDLSGVKEIGQYAFSGANLYDYQILEDGTITYAYEREFREGKDVAIAYKLSTYSSIFKTATLTNIEKLGIGAFGANNDLTTVTFGDKITEIPNYAFARCIGITEMQLPEQMSSVGEYAFYGTGLDNAELINVDKIGKYAFYNTDIDKATVKTGVEIGEGAFGNCKLLTKVNNLENAKLIGKYAFRGTSLKHANLTNVETVGDFAFADSEVTRVTFGENKLKALGENPFYGCNIDTYGKSIDVIFNGQEVGTDIIDNYDVSETVSVIDGVLYQKIKTGLELVSYPKNKVGKSYIVEEGTVRLTARAFMGAELENVTLPSTLKAIGDKAFYKCDKLSVVVFKSLSAPTLEEEYDTSYLSYLNLPFTGRMGDFEGLGIAPYYMWNVTASFSSFYFGANFVDYIGHVDNDLVMVRPANGEYYETFILSQYFGTVITGDNAATEATLSVIAMINALPKSVTLTDKEAVAAVRAAYDQIPSREQQALVGNYDQLVNAESIIAYLESEANKQPENTPPQDSSDSSSPDGTGTTTDDCSNVGAGFIGALIGIAVVSLAELGYVLLTKKKTVQESASAEQDENANQD